MKVLLSWLKEFIPDLDRDPEEIGEKLRGMMPWISAGKMVDKDKN